MDISLIFFGSFREYSAQVLESLMTRFKILTVITSPPAPSGRHLKLTPTAVAVSAKSHNLPVLELNALDKLPNHVARPDFLVAAGYGKLIPPLWLGFPKIMALNLHPSLLPQYRGRFPAEWAILRGEKQTGVTLIKMSPEFDKGEIISQKIISIKDSDTKNSLYTKLFALGSNLLLETLPQLAAGAIIPVPQPHIPPEKLFYARQLKREDGYLPWEQFSSQINSQDPNLSRKLRALLPWPGVWTLDPSGKRVKLLSLNPPTVQYESKKPRPW